MNELAKICPNCGKQNKITASFCEDCGTALNKVPNTPKQDNIQKNEQLDKPAGILDQIKRFWNARDTKGKALTSVAVCCLGVIIIGAIGGVLFPDKHITIGFNNATYDSLGTYHIDVNNSTTEYTISGYTEDGANLTVSSSDLNISAQRINLTSGNGFTYKVKIPANVTSATIRFEAVKAGKENTSVELTIKKVSTQVSSQATNTTPSTDTSSSDSSVTSATVGQEQAAKKAQEYLDTMPFSRSGLIKQLKFEGFTQQEAVYGVDQTGADWNEQAAKKAQSYLDTMSFSRSGLIKQLKFEGFTQQQAEYGVQAVGL
ncbi:MULTISPECIES: Ltp family lipoprotein [Methanobacterium]|uniref:Ltp family lipoprotein n=1 Tax=Methanobacterium veterum TaxID=408577 RepID=A0A9E5A0J2_9EURY|nr:MULTISPECIES: Ltp family lipoprotein [Methanobacterium]MCZ3366624.1 Ltp family lipoprotein [Methanobacterium veterum]MCZ3374232.1 Ltp family lipoprotein [Methanobacterium veterum]